MMLKTKDKREQVESKDRGTNIYERWVNREGVKFFASLSLGFTIISGIMHEPVGLAKTGLEKEVKVEGREENILKQSDIQRGRIRRDYSPEEMEFFKKNNIVVHPEIDCPPGFWQSNSTTVPFCVNKNRSDYDETPICIITDTCNVVTFHDIRVPLATHSETVIENWQHYANAVWGGEVKTNYISGGIGKVWPGLNKVQTTWGKVASLICEYGGCNQSVITFPIWDKILEIFSWGGLSKIDNIPKLVDLQNSQHTLTLGKIPAKWLNNVKIYDIVDEFNLWGHTIDSAGISQPTAGQAGMEYKQFIIVNAGQQNAKNLHGIIQFSYDNRIPSDLIPPGSRTNQIVISGTNRFLKGKCELKGTDFVGFNNCAYLQLRVHKDVPEKYNLYLMVSGLQEKLLGKGGGDWIAANTKIGVHNQILSGDFRGEEIVGSTNDEPLMPPGSEVTVGLTLDQCDKNKEYVVAHYISPGDTRTVISSEEYDNYYARTRVPAYYGDPCPNIFRKASHKKIVITMDAQYQYIHKINRVCEERQLYKIRETSVMIRRGKKLHPPKLPFATTLKTIYACYSIKEVKDKGEKYLSDSGKPILIPLRSGLINVQGNTAPED